MVYELPGLDEWLEKQCEGYYEEDEREYEDVTYDDWADDFEESLQCLC
jgi:hypothetical protein